MDQDQEPASTRLYSRFVSLVKSIQYIGYFIIVCFVALTFAVAIPAIQPIAPTIGAILQLVITVGIIFLFTQGLIAIVDLLSRIEQNTRLS